MRTCKSSTGEMQNFFHSVAVDAKWCNQLGKIFCNYLIKYKVHIPQNLRVPSLGIYPRQSLAHVWWNLWPITYEHRKVILFIFYTSISNIDAIQMLPNNEWISTSWCSPRVNAMQQFAWIMHVWSWKNWRTSQCLAE